jgi:hypothetical protein
MAAEHQPRQARKASRLPAVRLKASGRAGDAAALVATGTALASGMVAAYFD